MPPHPSPGRESRPRLQPRRRFAPCGRALDAAGRALFAPRPRQERRNDGAGRRIAAFFGGKPDIVRFANGREEDERTFVRRALSSSYVPAGEGKERYADAVRDVFARFAAAGKVFCAAHHMGIYRGNGWRKKQLDKVAIMKDEIFVKGAKENNLKNIDVHIPRGTLTVFTGLSGSGKSTLAFDTIFAEGQRRYVESLSSYARQFLGQMEKPNVESIDGLSPAISIDQKTTSHNPRSNRGGRSRRSTTICACCLRASACRIVRNADERSAARRWMRSLTRCWRCRRQQDLVNAPVVRGRKGEYTQKSRIFRKSGYGRVKIDGIVYDLQEDIKLDKKQQANISVVVDRLVVKEGIRKRLADSLKRRSASRTGWSSSTAAARRICTRSNMPAPIGRDQPGRGRAAPVFLQYAVRRLPRLRRPGL